MQDDRYNNDLTERLRQARARRPWLFEQQPELVGVITSIGTRETPFGATAPTYDVLEDSTGDTKVVSGAWKILADDLADARVGDRVAIGYLGRDERKKYRRFAVVLDQSNREQTRESE